jgi:hypothetical protein
MQSSTPSRFLWWEYRAERGEYFGGDDRAESGQRWPKLAGDGEGDSVVMSIAWERERGEGEVGWFGSTELFWSVWPTGLIGGPYLGFFYRLFYFKGPNCKSAITFNLGVQKLWKIYFWKAKNMTNSIMPLNESVRNKNLTMVLLINRMNNLHTYSNIYQNTF